MYDIIDFNNMVFMFKVKNNLFSDHSLRYFEKVCDSHNHNKRNRNSNYKLKYNRKTCKLACINIKGLKLWNKLPPHLHTCSTIYEFKINLPKQFNNSMKVCSNIGNTNNYQSFYYLYKVLDHVLICIRNTYQSVSNILPNIVFM